MKKNFLSIAALFLFIFSSTAQSSITIDLHNLVRNKAIDVYNRELSLVNEPSHMGISLSKNLGEGVAWLKGVEFSNGIIEFDVRGEDVKQHSFVGIAFMGKDNATFDAIYLRPFQFRTKDETLQNRMIQYISLPDFTWQALREQFPGKYEHSISPTPDPNSWIKMRIVIKDDVVTAYINNSKEPSLVITKLSHATTGSIGFYVADTSGGDFANLTITKTN